LGAYAAAYLVTCHGPCGNKEDDILFDMRTAACCDPDLRDCGGIMPGEGSTFLQGMCSKDFCNPLKAQYFNGCSKLSGLHQMAGDFFGRMLFGA